MSNSRRKLSSAIIVRWCGGFGFDSLFVTNILLHFSKPPKNNLSYFKLLREEFSKQKTKNQNSNKGLMCYWRIQKQPRNKKKTETLLTALFRFLPCNFSSVLLLVVVRGRERERKSKSSRYWNKIIKRYLNVLRFGTLLLCRNWKCVLL